MTPDVYVCYHYLHDIGGPVVLSLGVIGTNSLLVYVTPGTAAAVATATCDFLLRLLATCERRELFIDGGDIGGRNTVSTPLSGAGLSLFFQESRDDLQKVTLSFMTLSDDQCLALATMSRLDVEVTITHCRLADDAAGAFVECLQSDRGPVNLNWCRIDSQIIANALTGDSRVTSFKPRFNGTDDADTTAILFRALANNRGLVNLDLQNCSISDENWTILCQSLQAHPTLISLNLEHTIPARHFVVRTSAVAEMIKHNTILNTIELSDGHYDTQVYAEMIQPFLETNKYRPRVHAIKKADIPLRRPLLGLALQTDSVRNDANILWMFLSGNPDVVVQSSEDGEQAEVIVPLEAAAIEPVQVQEASRKRKL
jgi:hypothetical protein